MSQTPPTKKQQKLAFLNADIFKRSNSVTLILILFLITMLPILIVATMTETLNFSDARVPSSMPNAQKSVQLMHLTQENVSCDESSCSDGYIGLEVTNMLNQRLYIEGGISGEVSEVSGMHLQFASRDGTQRTDSNAYVLEPNETALAIIQFTNDYSLAERNYAGNLPSIYVLAYNCAHYDTLNHSAQNCGYVDQDNAILQDVGYRYRANNLTPASLTGNQSILFFSSIAVIDPRGRVIQPDPSQPPTISEEIIEPNSRSIITISWRDAQSQRPVEVKLYIQERALYWYMTKAEFIDPMISDKPFNIPTGPYLSLSDNVSLPFTTLPLFPVVSPADRRDTTTHTLVMHEAGFDDFRDPTSAPPARADIDNNGRVDINDFSLLLTDFGKSFDSPYYRTDLTADQKVDIYDYNIMLEHMGAQIEYWD